MNWLDIIFVILMVGSVAASFSKGLVREVIGLAVSVEVQASHHHRALDWFLEDSGAHFVAFPGYCAGHGHVE